MSGWTDAELAQLGEREEERRTAVRRMHATVAHLRAQGCPWSLIAEEIGVTKQAAQQRFGKQPASGETVETEPLF